MLCQSPFPWRYLQNVNRLRLRELGLVRMEPYNYMKNLAITTSSSVVCFMNILSVLLAIAKVIFSLLYKLFGSLELSSPCGLVFSSVSSFRKLGASLSHQLSPLFHQVTFSVVLDYLARSLFSPRSMTGIRVVRALRRPRLQDISLRWMFCVLL